MKRLLLVYPNQRWLKIDVNTTWNLNPASLCLLAAMVKDLVEIKIIDAQFYDLSIEKFSNEVQDFKPDYVGISVLSSEYGETLDITAALIKHIDQNIIIICGGVHPTIEYNKIITNENIDYICRGEGEFVLRKLLKYLLVLDKQENIELPSEGLVYIKKNKIIVQNPSIVDNESFKKLPWPDYSYIRLDDYLNEGPRYGPLRPPAFPYLRFMVTRGCPFGCSFCQVEKISGRKVRTRDPHDIVEELTFYRDTYNIKSIIFDDDNIIANKKFFRSLLKAMIEKELNLKFIIGAFAIFLLNDEILDLMVEAGCQGINIAVESGNKRVLKEIVGKPVNLDSIPGWIQKVQEKGLFCLSNFIIGFPAET
jgi:magnesium-protoporphyrin IX monomethyl ester (oxidative) cyclase